MKKILALALIMGLILTGCSKKNDTPAPTPTPSATPEATVPTDGETGDSALTTAVNGVLGNYDLPSFMNVGDSELKALYSINREDVEDYAIFKPMMNVHATEIIVITAAEGKLDAVKEAVEAYMTVQEENWSTYLPDQHELVKNRVVKEKGNTYIVVVAEEAEAIAADIEAAME